jgi:hypothetical protein
MAATTTTTATETIYAKLLAAKFIDAMYGVAVMDPLVRQESLVGKPSNTASFIVWPSLTAASIAETTDLSSTAVDTTNVDISVTEASSIRIDVTDLLEGASIVTEGAKFAAQGGKAVADKRDVDLAALLAGFSSTVGTSGVDLSEANLLDGLTTLTNADAPRPYVIVLHTQQVGDLRKALSTTTAVVQTNTSPAELGGTGAGFEFMYYGMPVYASTNVATANAGADRAGAIFSKGEALGRVDKRPIRVRPQRDESLRATEFNITSVYGQGELVDGWGVSVITDA